MASTVPSLGPKNKTIGSHPLIGHLLDINTLSNLLFVFDGDKDKNYDEHLLVKYIKEERIRLGVDTLNVAFESYLYYNGEHKDDPSLHLQIKKDGADYIHLSIHLAPKWLSHGLKDNGIIHFYKDIYEDRISIKKRYLLYAIVGIEKSLHKPNSLIFKINEGFQTPSYVSITPQNEQELQMEMTAVINVLNRLFDEDDRIHYIGHVTKKNNCKNNESKMVKIHPNADTVSSMMNSIKNQYISRPNRGYFHMKMDNRTHNKIIRRQYTQRHKSHNKSRKSLKRNKKIGKK